MSAGEYDITICRLGGLCQELYWCNENQEPVDLTGAKAWMQILQEPGGQELLSAPCELGDSARYGSLPMWVSVAEAEALPIGRACYSLMVDLPGKDAQELIKGDALVLERCKREDCEACTPRKAESEPREEWR